MKKISKFIVNKKWLIIIITLLLLIPAVVGYKLTKINYDILVYLPSDIETIRGEKILTEDFNMGAFSIIITDNMSSKDVLKLEDKIKDIDTVEKVVSVKDLTGTTIPIDILPSEVVNKISRDGSTLILVTFSNSTSDDKTLDAVSEIRKIVNKDTKVGGMSAMVLDTKELFNSEMLLYVAIAAMLCIVVLELFLDSYLVPILLMLNIGIAILFNMGSNILLGNISYITKAIAAVLQLGVTTDFSIFLYHKYENLKKTKPNKEEAMKEAICDTFTSVFGSSLTTIAGFLALCTMKLTLGVDIGLVMAKGVLFGVICVLTLFPALLLVFDKQIDKTKHKEILPKFTKIKSFILKNYIYIFIIFLLLLVPAYFAQNKTSVYYKLDESIPKNYGYSVATTTLKEDYGIVSQEMVLVPSDMENYKINEMIEEIKKVDGIDLVLSGTSLNKYGITDDMLPTDLKEIYEGDNYKMVLVTSNYDIATTELNDQITEVNKIVKKYNDKAILAGEGPLMKDLVNTTDIDFKNVNYTSIAVIFALMVVVLKSITLPVLLVIAIEFAIFINMGVPYFTGTEIPFIASVVIGTIQLGATIDYAILMTTKYLEERGLGHNKKEAVKTALDNSVSSIFVSAMCFFGATIGVGIISKIDMIGSLCRLISRGAIISMIVVVMIVPSILLIFDKLIIKTTYLKKGNDNMKKNKMKKVVATSLILSILLIPISTFALTKEETVYTKLNNDGSINSVKVNEHLLNEDNSDTLKDLTDLKDILNINGDNTYTITDNKIVWDAKGNDIFYQGTTDKKLPVTEQITYKLNGKNIKLDDLIGKSGKVEINIKYINNSKNYVKVNNKVEELYTPFVVATVTNLSTQNNSNVTVTNGKVVDNGLAYTVVGLSVPGLYESLGINEVKNLDNITITLETNKFELSSIYSVVTPKVLDSSDLDLFDKINTFYSSVDRLQSSINKIADGSSKIKENMDVVLEKLAAVKNGTVAIDEGLKQILTELEKAKSKLENSDMNTKLAQLDTLIEKDQETIDKLVSTNTLVTTTYSDTTKYNLSTMKYGDIEAMEPVIGTENVNKLISAKYQYENMGKTNTDLIKLLTVNKTTLVSLKESFTSSINDINTLITSLNTYLSQIESGAKELSDGTEALKQGVAVLDSKMGELNDGINAFNSEGISKLSSYAARIKQVSSKIDALVTLSNNYDSFSLKDNTTKSNTKFIMVVDSVSVPKKEIKKVEVKKKTSFWDRVVNLFK